MLQGLNFWYHAFKAKKEDIYSPLNTRRKEFRILQVEPGNGQDVIKCSLRPASLTLGWRPSYETVRMHRQILLKC